MGDVIKIDKGGRDESVLMDAGSPDHIERRRQDTPSNGGHAPGLVTHGHESQDGLNVDINRRDQADKLCTLTRGVRRGQPWLNRPIRLGLELQGTKTQRRVKPKSGSRQNRRLVPAQTP